MTTGAIIGLIAGAAVSGAVLAALIGLLGAGIQSRREHSRWVREQRLSAYAAFLRVAEQRRPSREEDPDGYRAFYDAQTEAIMQVLFVASSSVMQAAFLHEGALDALFRAMDKEPKGDLADPSGWNEEQNAANEAQVKTRWAFINAARKELGIRGDLGLWRSL